MVEFMMPATVLIRMLAVGVIRDDYMQLECMPVLLDNARKNIPMALFLGETLILRANYYMLCFLACPLTFVAASLDKQAQTQLMLKGVKFCPIDQGQIFALYFVIFPMVLPSYFSHYMMTLNELKLFDVIETLKKQQRIVLEIFERQKDGVVVIQKPADNDEKSDVDQLVVYANSAFKDIVQTDELEDGVHRKLL
jgi:hypothetical protein